MVNQPKHLCNYDIFLRAISVWLATTTTTTIIIFFLWIIFFFFSLYGYFPLAGMVELSQIRLKDLVLLVIGAENTLPLMHISVVRLLS